MLNIQMALAHKVWQLEEAMQHIKTLQGILPICANCHKIQNDDKSWEQLEAYIQSHSDAQFSHGICPDCFKTLYPDLMDE